MTSLLDVFKETDLRVGFTDEFASLVSRIILDLPLSLLAFNRSAP
jgi:hypothetical protein